MHVGHQYIASNFDPSTLKGLIAVDAYHISPDKGLGIFNFDNLISFNPSLSLFVFLNFRENLLRINESTADKINTKKTGS